LFLIVEPLFPTKVVAVWLHGSDDEHRALVRDYFERTGGWDNVHDRAYQPAWGSVVRGGRNATPMTTPFS